MHMPPSNVTIAYNPLEHMSHTNASEIHIYKLKQTGVNVIIAINSIARGPAIGGCRYVEYNSTADAIADAINLSYAMSLKAAFHNLPHGGAKAVIIKPNPNIARQALFNDFANLLNDLNGKYITSLDSGTSAADMDYIFEKTEYVLGHNHSNIKVISDPSYYTAKGVKKALEAAAFNKFGNSSLKNRSIAIMGSGNVGEYLLQFLTPESANITITDIDTQKAQRLANKYNCSYKSPTDFIFQSCDILIPCALGKVFTEENIAKLQTKIICGASNNQLSHESLALKLQQQGILYIPDYVANGGGLIFAAAKYSGYISNVEADIQNIKTATSELLALAASQNTPPLNLANNIALNKINHEQ
jgi:leucine dehydrogenase